MQQRYAQGLKMTMTKKTKLKQHILAHHHLGKQDTWCSPLSLSRVISQNNHAIPDTRLRYQKNVSHEFHRRLDYKQRMRRLPHTQGIISPIIRHPKMRSLSSTISGSQLVIRRNMLKSLNKKYLTKKVPWN